MDIVDKERPGFKKLSWWQWLLLALMAIVSTVLHSLSVVDATSPELAAQQGGALLGTFIGAIIIPYGLAYLVGRLARRSRTAFLLSLWGLALLVLAAQIGQLTKTSTAANSEGANASNMPITWPAGYNVTNTSIPVENFGGPLPGLSQTAIKSNPDGSPLTAIVLTSLPHRESEELKLDDQTRTLLATVRNSYEAQGMKAVCDTPVGQMLGGIPALQTTCTGAVNEVPSVKQVILVAIDKRQVYSLSFTARPADFVEHEAEFTMVRDSLHFQ
ncbi:hypothetical protein RsS62_31820 [Rhizobium dioscoreae]|uniref:DUF4946 domain-containing protein n=1 Tax=Rhizobium TaxID=379 RepID=UPI000DDD0117|nr:MULTISPECIES: DUF4946 domain-containing protein [Rhizobium]MCZ3380116.1 DUF4946 domain-containing protein [Rhizobium sp. AG207R]TWB14965.1 uncharacterized protein DUF4946 [Rhizobium sp. ERR1071]GES43930.1 hypothetical protein RsS62_31820 [Rhizobium dioscoreae]